MVITLINDQFISIFAAIINLVRILKIEVIRVLGLLVLFIENLELKNCSGDIKPGYLGC